MVIRSNFPEGGTGTFREVYLDITRKMEDTMSERERLTDGQEVAVATAHEILERFENNMAPDVCPTEDYVMIQVNDLENLLEIVDAYHEAMDELDTLEMDDEDDYRCGDWLCKDCYPEDED